MTNARRRTLTLHGHECGAIFGLFDSTARRTAKRLDGHGIAETEYICTIRHTTDMLRPFVRLGGVLTRSSCRFMLVCLPSDSDVSPSSQLRAFVEWYRSARYE